MVGLPALRTRGLTLGVVTLALAYAIEAVWFRNTDIVPSSGARVTPPSMFGIDLGIGAGQDVPPDRVRPRVPGHARRSSPSASPRSGASTLGSAMLAVRANERSAAAAGVNVVRVKVLSFALASFIAGLGGSLLAYRRGVVTFDSFTAIGGLALLSTAYLAGITSVWGGINAGILASSGITFIALDRWVDLGEWFEVISGVAPHRDPDHQPRGHRRRRPRARRPLGRVEGRPQRRRRRGRAPGGRRRRSARADRGRSSHAGRRGRDRPAPPSQVDHLTVRYGGVVAVNDVSLRVEPRQHRRAHRSQRGRQDERDRRGHRLRRAPRAPSSSPGARIDGLAPHARVRAGLARTFQSLELYDDLSVEENVSVAALGGRQARPPRRGRPGARAASGSPTLRDRPAGELSQGERQLVSIARACVADPRCCCSTSPPPGSTPSESALARRAHPRHRATGTGVLLVDHDVSLVLSVCDHVYVLDFGAVIAEGPPDAIRADRAVADAYLGTMHDTEAVTA